MDSGSNMFDEFSTAEPEFNGALTPLHQQPSSKHHLALTPTGWYSDWDVMNANEKFLKVQEVDKFWDTIDLEGKDSQGYYYNGQKELYWCTKTGWYLEWNDNTEEQQKLIKDYVDGLQLFEQQNHEADGGLADFAKRKQHCWETKTGWAPEQGKAGSIQSEGRATGQNRGLGQISDSVRVGSLYKTP